MKRYLLAIVLLLMGTPALLAQSSTGSILGVVQDASSAVIPDAQVTVTNTATNISKTTTSGSDGSFRVDALQPGPYKVTVVKDGFQTSNLTNLTLEVTQQLRANATLQVGAQTQEISVSSDTVPQVDTTQSALGGTVNAQQVAELPLNGRNFIDLALLQPGVANNARNGPSSLLGQFFSSNGAPIRSNNVMLDGAPMMNVKGTTGSAVGTTLGVDGIQEFRVLTNSFGAQYGISLGSQTIIASKGGTNQFHGDVFDYLRNNDLDARGYFAKREPKLIRNSFGGAFGGPIKKDKTFFWGVYEGIRQVQDIVTTINDIPTAIKNQAVAVNPAIQPLLALYPVPNGGIDSATNVAAVPTYTYNQPNPESVDYAQLRVDQKLNDRDSLFGRYTWDRSDLQVLNSYEGTAYQNVGSHTTGRDQFITASETHTFTAAVLNNFRASFSRTIQNVSALIPDALGAANLRTIYNQPMGIVTITGGASIGAPGNLPQVFTQNLYSISDDVNWNKGKHSFQIGGLFNRIEYYTNNSNMLRGTLTFGSNANFAAGNYSSVTGITPGSVTKRAPRFYTMGVYIQDDWRIAPRLTLNLGIRYEPDSVPFDREGANVAFRNMTDADPTFGPIMRNPSRKNFGPRVGFNWDVFGNGKTSVRSAFGEYYDVNAFGFTFFTTGGGTPPLAAATTFTNGTLTSLPVITASSNLVPGAEPYGSSLHTTNYDTQQPHLIAWNASIAQQLTGSLSLTVAYVGTRGIHLWDTDEGNPCFPNGTDSRGLPTYQNPYLIKGTRGDGTLTNPLTGKAQNVTCLQVTNPGTSSAALVTGKYPNGTSFLVPNRLNPYWGDWILNAPKADSYYNAMQVILNKRASHGLESQVAYTWSSTRDDGQGLFATTECIGSGGLPSQVIQPYRKQYDTGPSCFDIPQQVQASVIYHLPKSNFNNFVGREVLSGWWLGNKTTYEGGLPFHPSVNNWRSFDQNITSNNNGAGSTDNVSYGTVTVAPGQTGADGTVNTTSVTFVPYNKGTVLNHNPTQWYNPLMFTINPQGQLGTVTRNAAFRGPHFATVDLSLNKDTALPFLGEKGSAEFRIEAFNLFNHTNFSLPNGHAFAGTLTDVGLYTEAPTAAAGQITSITGQPRQVQLSLKVMF